MTDNEKICLLLKQKEQSRELVALFQEMVFANQNGPSKGVTALLQRKAEPLNNKFNCAYQGLHEKIGQ